MKRLILLLSLVPMMAFGQIRYSGVFYGNGSGLTNVVAVASANGNQSSLTIEQIASSNNVPIGPCYTIYDASAAINSTTMTSASGGFANAKPGQWMVVYTNSYDTNWIIDGIASVQSATQITLSNAVPQAISGNGLYPLNYGFNSFAAFSNAPAYCYANNIHVCQLSNCMYFAYGPLQLTGTNLWSLFNTPIIGEGAINGIYKLTYRGVCNMNLGLSGYFSAVRPQMGTIIYTPISMPNGTNGIIFADGTGTNGVFNFFGEVFDGIGFMQPIDPQMTEVSSAYGGDIEVDNSSFFTDYGFQRQNVIYDTNYPNAYAIQFGQTGNSGVQLANCVVINGFGGGIQGYEHTELNNVAIGNCGLGLFVGNGVGTFCPYLQLLNNITNCLFGAAGICRLYGFIDDERVPTLPQNIDFSVPQQAYGQIFVAGQYPPDFFYQGSHSGQLAAGTLRSTWFSSAQNSSYDNYLAVQCTGGDGSWTNSANNIVIGGAYGGNAGPPGYNFNSQYSQGVEHFLGTDGAYGFDTAGNIQYTWNLSGNNTLGTLYSGSLNTDSGGVTVVDNTNSLINLNGTFNLNALTNGMVGMQFWTGFSNSAAHVAEPVTVFYSNGLVQFQASSPTSLLP